jgi:Ni2+-binding GTPase involved in maturation of urease and hydrogenase
MNSNIKEHQREADIILLEQLAAEILVKKESVLPRRPIVIEFCGSPKAGKTSCISALEMFLKRNDIRTTVITERGAICPIYNKFDPNFNVWAGCSELARFAEIMSNHFKDFDVVIMDRGFFDAVCWFQYQMKLLKLDQDS